MTDIIFYDDLQDQENAIDSFSGDYEFLSNFAFVPSGIVLNNIFYSSVEHAYQAAKTFSDKERDFVRIQPTPGLAKKVGRNVTIRKDWETVKIQVMYDLLIQKFSFPDFNIPARAAGSINSLFFHG